jgi:hypothetical protein
MSNTMITTTEGSTNAVEQNYNINPGYAFDGATMSPAQLEQSVAAFKAFQASMPPLIKLNDKQRRRTPRVGVRTRGFVELFVEGAKKDSTILPAGITLSQFLAQVDLLNSLSLLQTHVADCKNAIDDSTLTVAAHVYALSRSGYALLNTPAGETKLPDQKELMKQRFVPKAKRSQSTTDEAQELAA